MAVVSVRDLKKSYRKGFIPKRTQVLTGLNFDIQPGVVTGFLGGNGAGKTTTMKCLLGLVFPDSGELTYFGQPGLTEAAKQKIGFLPERPYFYEHLTGIEFLRFYGQLSIKMSSAQIKQRSEDLLKRVDLWHAKDRLLREYSKGMLQKVGLAQALIHRPELVILDEPTSGLDPDGRYYLSELIRETASEGTAVFLSSHQLNDAERICEQLVILREGRLVFNGDASGFLDQMGVHHELVLSKGGERTVCRIDDSSEIQKRLKQVMDEGYEVLELNRQRVSLEEAFVRVGLRGEQNV